MVATVASATTSSTNAPTKKCPPNIRTGSVQPPVLVSPISVAHGNAMVGTDGGKKGANWMRDQWVANLKKKRMAGPGGSGGEVAPEPTASVASVGPVPTVKAGIRAESSRSGEKSTASRSKRTSKSKNAAANAQAAMATADKDSLSLMHPAMFLNDLGCFELESPSFMRLTPTTRGGDSGLLSAMASPAQASASLKTDKKWMKPLMKKRSNCFSSDINEPKRRTPRRPNSANGSFDDSDTSSQHSYTSVGTPSNFSSADVVSRMWGPELDFPTGYVDTFLDLPTPKSAEMPTMSCGSGGLRLASTPSSLSSSKRTELNDDLEQPKLVRTTSIEQEGLSHFFEQTNLGNPDGGDESCRQPAKSTKQQQQQHAYSSQQHAAAGAVDECFGKMVPSPAHYAYANGRCMQPTPKGTLRLHHHGGRGFSFDPKKASTHASAASEFDTLVQEYVFTDFDQELDSFYLDTIESFSGDLDLISS